MITDVLSEMAGVVADCAEQVETICQGDEQLKSRINDALQAWTLAAALGDDPGVRDSQSDLYRIMSALKSQRHALRL